MKRHDEGHIITKVSGKKSQPKYKALVAIADHKSKFIQELDFTGDIFCFRTAYENPFNEQYSQTQYLYRIK